MAERTLTVGEVVGESAALCRTHAAFLAIATLAIATGYIVLDLFTEGAGTSFAGIVVGIFVQFLVVERLLADQLPGGKAPTRRYGAMFGAAILGGLGILLGFVLLIVPGMILMAAWSASTPFIIAEDMGGSKALGASWEMTRGSRVPLTVVVAIGLIAFAAAVAALFGGLYVLSPDFTLEGTQRPALSEIVPSNLLASVFGVLGWVFGAAVYRLLKPAGESLKTVFA